ncbi:hydrogenase maturation nickel metallochaperone HypA [Aeromonas sp. AE23HZ002T15]
MHEMSLAMAAIDLAAEQASQRGFSKVTAIWLEVGSFSCVDPDTIAFCFEAAAKGTAVEGASLHFQHQIAEGWCYDCSKTVALAERGQACPECGGYKLRVAQGDSLRITDIEVS